MYVYLNPEERCTVLAALELLAHARRERWELPRMIEQMETSTGRELYGNWPLHSPQQLGDLMDWILQHSIPPCRVRVEPASQFCLPHGQQCPLIQSSQLGKEGKGES